MAKPDLKLNAMVSKIGRGEGSDTESVNEDYCQSYFIALTCL